MSNLVRFELDNSGYPNDKWTMTIPKSYIIGIQAKHDVLYVMMKDGRNERVNMKHLETIVAILEELYD